MTLLSFVIPCYRSEQTIEKVIDEIKSTVCEKPEYDYEIICVNDCSPDSVLEVLERLASGDNKIRVVNLVKNMGKHAAVLAGYSFAKGEYVVDLDDDLQSPTYELWKLLEPVEQGLCDYATARYEVKKESRIKRLGSDLNLRMAQFLLDKPKGLRFENFNVMRSFVCKEMVKYNKPYPYIEGLVLRTTNRVMAVPMEQRSRGDDNGSGFTLKKSISLVLNGMTAFSVKPLRIGTVMGAILSAVGFVFGIIVIVRRLLNPEVAIGWSSLMSVVLFSAGLILIMLGLIGEYVGRIYICLNESPQYVIRNTINIEK